MQGSFSLCNSDRFPCTQTEERVKQLRFSQYIRLHAAEATPIWTNQTVEFFLRKIATRNLTPHQEEITFFNLI